MRRTARCCNPVLRSSSCSRLTELLFEACWDQHERYGLAARCTDSLLQPMLVPLILKICKGCSGTTMKHSFGLTLNALLGAGQRDGAGVPAAARRGAQGARSAAAARRVAGARLQVCAGALPWPRRETLQQPSKPTRTMQTLTACVGGCQPYWAGGEVQEVGAKTFRDEMRHCTVLC